MKRFSILTAALVVMLILSACGAGNTPTTPTISPVDLQSTMMSAAMQIVAETQAAIPTATPIPPTATFTNTPFVTATLPLMPTLGATFTALPGGNPGIEDPCVNQVLPATLQGDPIRIRIDNPTRAAINVSVYLLQSTQGGVCGYRSYTLAAGDSLVLNNLVEACYTIWAWNPDPDDYFMVTNGTSCLDDSNTWAFDVSTSSIRLRP